MKNSWEEQNKIYNKKSEQIERSDFFLFETIQIFWNHICLHLATETFWFLWKKFTHFLAIYWPLQWHTLRACL